MKLTRLGIAAVVVMLMLPAALFMAALLVRNFELLPLDLAGAAGRIVNWYAGRMWTLWLLLLALPFLALAIGWAALRRWNRGADERESQMTRLLVMAATVSAGAILVIVVLHMAAN